MKILLLIARFPPESIGGAEIAAYNIANELGKIRKNEVHVVTIGSNGSSNQNEYYTNFIIHKVSTILLPLVGNLIYSIKCLLISRKIQPDIIHSHSISFNNSGLAALIISKFTGVPYLVSGQGSDVYLKKNIILRFFRKQILYESSAVTALTQDMKNQINTYYSGEISIIPNGTSSLSFLRTGKKANAYSRSSRNNFIKILYVGRLHPIKGLEYLIEAMSIIKKETTTTKLIIVGDGVEKPRLENLTKKFGLQEYISFIGEVPHDAALKYMNDADIFVLPSLSEGFPLTIIEAMATGLPIITTDVRGLSEIIKHGENGFLVKPKNPEQIAKYAVELIINDQLMKNISMNNIDKSRSYYWDKIAEKYQNEYYKIINGENEYDNL